MNETSFITDIHVEDVTEGTSTQTLRLLKPFTVYVESLDAIITVPEGFTFDGESIPLVLQGFVKPFGQSKRGACVHDYLYRYGGYHTVDGTLKPVTRAQADRVYYELVRAKGLSAWRANVRWGVLRLVGWINWGRKS